MLKLTIFFAVVAVAAAATTTTVVSTKNYAIVPEKEIIPIVHSTAQRKDDGSFRFAYEGADGSFREEVGIVHNAGTDEEQLEVSGTYRYIDADGQTIEVKYTAGKDGFVPEGNNIPEEISIAAKAAAEVARRQPVEV